MPSNRPPRAPPPVQLQVRYSYLTFIEIVATHLEAAIAAQLLRINTSIFPHEQIQVHRRTVEILHFDLLGEASAPHTEKERAPYMPQSDQSMH